MDVAKPFTYVGIDISKLTFDACVVRAQGKSHCKQFSNSSSDFAKLVRWVCHLSPDDQWHFCMEATGAHHIALATYLAEEGLYVSVVNPFRAHHSALAGGASNKTDAADAKDLAEFARKESPPLWRRAAPEVRTLIALMRRLQVVKDQIAQERNRKSEPNVTPEVRASINKCLAFLTAEAADLRKQITRHIDQYPNLKADRDLLVTIPAIGDLTAAWLLAELPDVNLIKDAPAAAACAGLAPVLCQSGTSVRKVTRLSKRGSAHLRRAIYMPAMAAVRWNPAVKALYDRLIAKGRHRMVAMGAAMRKLIMIAYGVLKHRKVFQYPAT